jgi:hypothetical protein
MEFAAFPEAKLSRVAGGYRDRAGALKAARLRR